MKTTCLCCDHVFYLAKATTLNYCIFCQQIITLSNNNKISCDLTKISSWKQIRTHSIRQREILSSLWPQSKYV